MEKNQIISCGIYLFNNNKFLIGHPTGFRPNIWSIPKGRMNKDETDYFETAKRELLEETGLNLDTLNVLGIKELDIIQHRETNKYLKAFCVKVSDNLEDMDIKCESMVYRNGKPAFPEFDDFKLVTIEESRPLLNEFQYNNLDICANFINENHSFKYLKHFYLF